MNTVILVSLSSDEHKVRKLVGLEEINYFLNVPIIKCSVKLSEIDISDLGSSLDINAINVDTACCFLNTFLLLDVRFILKNIQGDILTTVSLELFNFKYLIDQLLSLKSLWVILFENVNLSHKVHKSLFIG